MPQEENPRQFQLHFEGPATHNHTLPATALVQALQQFQRSVHLLAMAREGREVRMRARVTYEIERRFPLVCNVPVDGGYILPLVLGDPSQGLFTDIEIDAVANIVRDVLRAVNDGDPAKIAGLIPDRLYRAGVLTCFGAMQPSPGSQISVSVENRQSQKLLDGAVARTRIEALRAPPLPRHELPPSYVAGRLIEMKFQERRLKLQLLGTNRSLDATYGDDFEPVLLQHPRDLIQVHGNVVFGDDGAPTSISDVDEILEIDDSDIKISSIQVGGHIKRSRQPLSFTVTFDRDSNTYEAIGPFDIILGAETRSELEVLLAAELDMLWHEYGQAEPETLTSAAQNLRAELISTFADLTDAT